MYKEKIEQEKHYLQAIKVAMRSVFEVGGKGPNEKQMKKQQDLFGKLVLNEKDDKKFKKIWKLYYEKITKNLGKLKNKFIVGNEISEIKKTLESDTRKFTYKQIDDIMSIITKDINLKDVINSLSSEYKKTLGNIKMYENFERTEKERQQSEVKQPHTSSPKKTQEDIALENKKARLKAEEEEMRRISNCLLEGPKKSNLIELMQGKDKMIDDMKYLYGLALDILIIMEADQRVNIKNIEHGKDARIWNAYFGYAYDKSKLEKILKAYDVNSIDSLIDKYEKIRSVYYKKYKNLSSEKKAKYDISKFKVYDISSVLEKGNGVLVSALKNENLDFPPTKEMLVSLINNRIMCGHNYKLVEPQKREDVITGKPQDYNEYDNIKKYYKNLTKNMSMEQIVNLYKRVNRDIREQFKYSLSEEIDFDSYYAIMQKLFCEIIFEREEKKYSDSKQYDEALEKISNKYLKEDLKFSIYGHDKLNEDETKKRQEEITKSYVKYRAELTARGEKNYLSFSEFAKKKYSLENVTEPLDLENMIKRTLK